MSLFSNISKRTNSGQKDADLRPITLRMGGEMSLIKFMEFLPEYNFDVLTPRQDYHEIYARKDEFEFTISFIEDFGKTHVSILCYSETKPLKIKKNLKLLMVFIREKMDSYII